MIKFTYLNVVLNFIYENKILVIQFLTLFNNSYLLADQIREKNKL